MVQDDRGPLFWREALKAPVELVTESHGPLGIGRHRLAGRVQRELDHLAPPASFRGSVAGTHEESMEPGLEPVRVTKPA